MGHLSNCFGSVSVTILVLIACLSKDSLCNRYLAAKAAKAIGRGTNWTAFAYLIETLMEKHTQERRRADA
jgi:Na+/pantothenate symporter